MQHQETTETTATAKGRMPTHRLWMVEDLDGKPHWTPLTGLWPSKKGALSGQLDLMTAVPYGARIVITRAKSKTGDAQ